MDCYGMGPKRPAPLTPAWPCLTFNNLNGKIPNRENQVQKVLKSEMFEMLVFCCKLHRNLMIHENVMLQLHGKTHTKWVFSKNPHVFTLLHFFCKKKWRYCTKKQLPIMRIWWFLQYLGSMRTNEENTACSEWKYTFQHNSEGKQEGKSARGRGVGALLLLLFL